MRRPREYGVSPNRIRELRENKLMTQAQLARKARVSVRTVHSVENGCGCQMGTKRKLLLALGISMDRRLEVFFPRPQVSL